MHPHAHTHSPCVCTPTHAGTPTLQVHDELDGGEWKFCEGRPQGHDRFGFCQQGLAAAFSPDQHYVLFGAPGTYNWKGERGGV